MIELIDVHKTYKSKKGKNTHALNGVNINFDTKGMTFILGKSGSGKSTLLNVLGGLDKYDSGDMIILGKSSKEFTQRDLDSYRNTYVGFVFQEFNILEDYDVYNNIILALDLQQKSVDEKEVNKLLDYLELTELKKRKVNELSGGQKQRVAIARALIKNPKIILADEPTGNLDSKTGKQVMELLKEISKEKLVVIVSHDEEYAKTYGDRIIEIKDGQIISDTNKNKSKEKDTLKYETIKSKLPFKASFKLGIGSLKHKKIKLVFTIILIIFTLGFLSCTDTLANYNYAREHAKVLSEVKDQFVEIKSQHITKNEYGNSIIEMKMDAETEKIINEKVGKKTYPVYSYSAGYSAIDAKELLYVQSKMGGSYTSTSANLIPTLNVKEIYNVNLIGRDIAAEDEILITTSLASQMMENGVEVYENVVKTEFVTSNIFTPTSYEDILNCGYTFHFGEKGKVKIVGIVAYDTSAYKKGFEDLISSTIYVHPNLIEKYANEYTGTISDSYSDEVVVPGQEEGIYRNNSATVLKSEVEYFNGEKWVKTNSINDNEIILSIDAIGINDYYNDLNQYTANNPNIPYDIATKRFLANLISTKGIIGTTIKYNIYYGDSYAKDVYKSYDLKVIGVCEEYENGNFYSSGSLISPNLQAGLEQQQVEKRALLVPANTKEEFRNLTEMFPVDSELAIHSTYSNTLYYESNMFDAIKTLAQYAALIFFIFTVILITNFMFTSISYRKKEIGVLRALGSSNKDVTGIFLWEAVCLSVISGTIASILLVVVTNFMNSYILKLMGTLTTPFLVTIRQFIVIFVVVFALTFIASILPIRRISRMKPIDAILNK